MRVDESFSRLQSLLTDFCSLLARVDYSRWELTKTLMRVNSHPRLAQALYDVDFEQNMQRFALFVSPNLPNTVIIRPR